MRYIITKLIDQSGFCRPSFFKRNRHEILAALSDMGHDVSEGSKIYGRDLSKCRQSKAKTETNQKSNLYISRSSNSGSPPFDNLDQLARDQNTAPSPSQSYISNSESVLVPSVSKFAIGDQCNYPLVNEYDVSLPFPAVCWATTSNE